MKTTIKTTFKTLCWSLVFLGASLYAAAQEQDMRQKPRLLYVYERRDEKLDPWRQAFLDEMTRAGLSFEEMDALTVTGKNLEPYDVLLIHGSVIAFSFDEPVRDWLENDKNMNGKKAAFFVTANRWFLEKYAAQLQKLAEKRNLVVLDAVSSATQHVDEAERASLVREFVGKLIKR